MPGIDSRIQLDAWSIQVPDGWEHEIEDGIVSLFHPEGGGALTVSSVTKAEGGDVNDDDLLEFIADARLADATCHVARHGPYVGFRLSTEDKDKGTAWQHWFLRAGTQMLFITYNCNKDDTGREDIALAQALDSLRVEMSE